MLRVSISSWSRSQSILSFQRPRPPSLFTVLWRVGSNLKWGFVPTKRGEHKTWEGERGRERERGKRERGERKTWENVGKFDPLLSPFRFSEGGWYVQHFGARLCRTQKNESTAITSNTSITCKTSKASKGWVGLD